MATFDQQKNFEEFFKKMENDLFANPEKVGAKEGVRPVSGEIHFDMKPEELESYLNKYVIGQEDAIEVIATKVCTHFNRMKLEKTLSDEQRVVGSIKSNMLLVGPTGVGKTYIVKLIANKIGVPFVKADATKFSETGYVGGDVEDLVRELVHEADGDIAKAEYGIIYLDEIDKIASSGSSRGLDVSRSGVQRNLLKLMEDAEVDLKTPHDLASQVEAAMEAQRTGHVKRKKISTRNILFIVSGAFGGLVDIIRKRLNYQAIGFTTEGERGVRNDSGILKRTRTEDLIEFGFESEFVGRLPVTVVLNDVDHEVLYRILKNRFSSVVLGKKMDFKAYGIDVEFSDDALYDLAGRAALEKTGARGLLSVFENLLIKYEKTLPSLHNVKTLLVDRDLVQNPEKKLNELLVSDSIKGFQSDFFVRHNILLSFDEEAITKIQQRATEQRSSFSRICEDLFHDYSYALKLLKLERFTITGSAVENPTAFIEQFVRDNYRKEGDSPQRSEEQ